MKKSTFKKTLAESDIEALIASLDQTALVSMTDSKGNILYANKKFLDVSKYSLDELIGQNHRILKSGQQPDKLFVELWKTISAGKVWRGEIKNRAKDGSYYWVDALITPILDESGKPERYISVRLLINNEKTLMSLQERAQKQVDDLNQANKFMIGREIKMVELKKKISELEKGPYKTKKTADNE